MKLKLINLLLFLNILIGCTSNEDSDKPDTSETEEHVQKTSPINCYRYAGKSDTILLKVIHIGKALTGTLVYKLEGKDKNQGTIQGSMKDDILVADYTFQSEGIQSVRQVAFKLMDAAFIEGYGETEMQNEKVQFKDIGSLEFNDSMKLTEIACE